MSLFDAMEEVIKCPRCGSAMEKQSRGPGDFPWLLCPACGLCIDVRG